MSGMAPFFSIILPVYNVAPFLRECLESVLAQTFQDWECVCIDDGSTDGCGAIFDEYVACDKRFRVVHQPNAGVSVARNAALDIAKGEWIVFLDGDDLLKPDALARLSVAVAPNIDIIRYGFLVFDENMIPKWEPAAPNTTADVDVSRQIDMALFYAYVWQHTYRRSRVRDLRFPRYRRGEDRVFFDAFLLDRVNILRVLEATLYGYRQRATSAVHAEPSTQVLLDEMDHRLDIIRMIDDSPKTVIYAGNRWLEGHFTREFPLIAGRRKADRRALVAAWCERMRSLRSAKGFSRWGAFLARLASRRATFPLAWLLCYWVSRIRLSIRYRMGIVRRRLCERRERR